MKTKISTFAKNPISKIIVLEWKHHFKDVKKISLIMYSVLCEMGFTYLAEPRSARLQIIRIYRDYCHTIRTSLHTRLHEMVFFYLAEVDSKGYCSFPRFLWRSPTDDSSIRKWIGQTEYFGNTDSWTNQLIITAHETEIVTQRRVHVTCTRQRNVVPSDKIPCYRQDTVFSIICLSEEPNGKYRVQQVELK